MERSINRVTSIIQHLTARSDLLKAVREHCVVQMFYVNLALCPHCLDSIFANVKRLPVPKINPKI